METPATVNADGKGPQTAFAELSRISLREHSLSDTLQRVVELAQEVLVEAADVSITFVEQNKPHTVAFTGALAVELDELQYENGYGPCTDAAISAQTVVVDHRGPDSPYPDFSRSCRRAGVTHTVSVGMPVAQRTAGAINIYATNGVPLDDANIQLAEIFAGYAAVTIANATHFKNAADQARHMQIAMESRAAIEQAKGIIMAQTRCTDEEAFAVLTKTSQRQNRKLRQVAETVVQSVQKRP